jgi:hypothetical protein
MKYKIYTYLEKTSVYAVEADTKEEAIEIALFGLKEPDDAEILTNEVTNIIEDGEKVPKTA